MPGVSNGVVRAGRWVLGCLGHLPIPLCAPLAASVLLDPFTAVVGGASAAHRLLLELAMQDTDSTAHHSASRTTKALEARARTPAPTSPATELTYTVQQHQRSVLHHLGFKLGILEWQKDWEGMVAAGGEQSTTEAAPTLVEGQEGLGEVEQRDGVQETRQMTSKDQPSSQPYSTLEAQPQADGPRGETGKATSVKDGRVGRPAECLLADVAGRREVVEAIRREEFGIGLQLEGAAASLREVQNARMGRALSRLSQELYSRDSHFVLELVQNADDNSYPPGVTPTLQFVLHEDRITVLNNEVGFSEANLRALCDVGRSTKANVSGYIGQKGIGFKSVFRVTDCPEVHSNGFHVAFDLRRHAALGYILPSQVI
ncbi:DUF3883 domain-containing protein [Haematococcus lacustris]|uniref:DUF3883 domain-containing protein n=1 Tax=Haematococcus lacustris TaxID=44745 RepID=A0A6A0A7E8_HAELA|nr:DUF3883 domain-containing protein [Haematococcus lacustris]